MSRIERVLKVLELVTVALSCLGFAIVSLSGFIAGDLVLFLSGNRIPLNPYFIGVCIVSVLSCFVACRAAIIAAYRR